MRRIREDRADLDRMPPALILFVEDEPLIMALAQALLEERGYDVIVAVNGRQALSVLAERASQITAMITEVGLRGDLSGWQLAREARRHFPELPIIYTTGGLAHQWAAEHVENGLLVQKPYIPEQIFEALTKLTGPPLALSPSLNPIP